MEQNAIRFVQHFEQPADVDIELVSLKNRNLYLLEKNPPQSINYTQDMRSSLQKRTVLIARIKMWKNLCCLHLSTSM